MKSRFLLAAMLVATLPPATLTAQRSQAPAAAPQNATARTGHGYHDGTRVATFPA